MAMFQKLFTHKLRTELAEIEHQHQLEIQEMKAEIAREKKHSEEDKKRTEKQLKDEHEIKLKEVLTLTKLDSTAHQESRAGRRIKIQSARRKAEQRVLRQAVRIDEQAARTGQCIDAIHARPGAEDD